MWGSAGQGRGCLGSTSQKGLPGTRSKIIMSVFGRSLPEKGRLILYVGDQKVLEIFFIHVGFALVILKPCSYLMQVISLSLISGAGDRSWEKPVRKQYILLNYIHSFFFLMVFRLTVSPFPQPTPLHIFQVWRILAEVTNVLVLIDARPITQMQSRDQQHGFHPELVIRPRPAPTKPAPAFEKICVHLAARGVLI